MKQKISVLFAVREESVVRRLMQEMDDGETCVFYIATSGVQALSIAAKMQVDILVVDAILPGLDGAALVDRLGSLLGAGTPRVIGGAMLPFAKEMLLRRGVDKIVSVPWKREEVRAALVEAMEDLRTGIDWKSAEEGYRCACAMLERLGMHTALNGYAFLSWAAAIAAQSESRLHALGERIYAPIAEKYSTTPQNVERLIRHAVESTMDCVGAEALYAFFGNTIDPTRGKPTNAQMIGMLAQKVRVGGK